MADRKRVLFLCVHNSVRSILAEHLVNHFRGDRFVASSAGLESTGVNPHTRRVLEEIGIDTAAARSKRVDEFRGAEFDLVVTVCGPSEGECPAWFGKAKQAHLPFEDPGRAPGSEAELLARFRATRDEIRATVLTFLDDLWK
ncbi:MAG: arsenate reductase ArsC [Chloroflexi bacterium]|nr:arsenate reductase ArsC [Chloroflexota bacterium]